MERADGVSPSTSIARPAGESRTVCVALVGANVALSRSISPERVPRSYAHKHNKHDKPIFHQVFRLRGYGYVDTWIRGYVARRPGLIVGNCCRMIVRPRLEPYIIRRRLLLARLLA